MLVDTHCHIHDARFDTDRAQVLQRAREAGVGIMISIGCDLETTKRAQALAQVHKDVYFSAGYHPHEARLASKEVLSELKEIAQDKKCVAIGECGLDYYYNHSPKEAQLAVFNQQIELAKELKKALVIHVRDAFEDCLEQLKGFPFREVPVVIHCFTGSLEIAKRFLNLGCIISISGIATFKDPGELDQVIVAAPLDQLLVETDSPYLAPLPYRGKRNEPSYVVNVAQKVAELKQIEFKGVSEALTRNSLNVFKIGIN